MAVVVVVFVYVWGADIFLLDPIVPKRTCRHAMGLYVQMELWTSLDSEA